MYVTHVLRVPKLHCWFCVSFYGPNLRHFITSLMASKISVVFPFPSSVHTPSKFLWCFQVCGIYSADLQLAYMKLKSWSCPLSVSFSSNQKEVRLPLGFIKTQIVIAISPLGYYSSLWLGFSDFIHVPLQSSSQKSFENMTSNFIFF